MKRTFFCISILFGYDTPAIERIRRVCSELHFIPLLSIFCVIRCMGTPSAVLVTWGLISKDYSSQMHQYSERV
ncbi:MAG: hypothetical protein IPH75_04380 [bacterium]|nr:hypothetical protein [bacterium]